MDIEKLLDQVVEMMKGYVDRKVASVTTGGLTFAGEYESGREYTAQMVVRYQSALWCAATTTATAPESPLWMLVMPAR